jgi:hypothetical protein
VKKLKFRRKVNKAIDVYAVAKLMDLGGLSLHPGVQQVHALLRCMSRAQKQKHLIKNWFLFNMHVLVCLYADTCNQPHTKTKKNDMQREDFLDYFL